MPSSASCRVSTTIGRTGNSANAAASACPTWPPPKISTCGRLASSALAACSSASRFASSTSEIATSTRPPQHWPISGPSGMSRLAGRRRTAEHFPCPVDRHEFELAAADGSVDRAGRDEHPCPLLARRRAFCVRHFDEGHGGRSVEEGAKAFRGGGHGRKTITAEYPMLRDRAICAASARSRSTAISTRSGVAGASRRGQIR